MWGLFGIWFGCTKQDPLPVKGLKGDADSNNNKRITLLELKSYLGDKVSYRARRLTSRDQAPVVRGKFYIIPYSSYR
jgi:hypothetical protein